MAARNPHKTRRGVQPKRPVDDSERAFLARYDASEFERLSVAVDVALLSVSEGALRVRLVRRDQHPSKGKWSLPGGFVGAKESLESAAQRVLRDKAGIGDVFLEQLYTFGDPSRDPRTRVVSVAHYALVDEKRFLAVDSARKTRTEIGTLSIPWEGETGGAVEVLDPQRASMPLAFDHESILGMAVKRLRGKLDYTPIGFQLLPPRFTLRALQDVHEAILGRPLNKDSFRRRMLASDQLEATGEREGDVEHRPAEIYRFRRRSAV